MVVRFLKPMGRAPGTGVAAEKKAGEVKKSLAQFHPPIKKVGEKWVCDEC